jgi:histidine triad (HIT) family protein
MEDCIFCKIVTGEMPCFKVYEDDNTLAFADINPVTEGHTLIIPKAHAENLWEITGESLTAVHLASKKVIQGIKDALNPTGVIALQLNGKGANQLVMHYHLHLVPRVSGSPEILAIRELKQGDMDAISQTAEKIASAIK